jgi:tRNA A37 threonylcarbamoyladenosine synthetase subunit TsaC/SUA5/YrdC
MTRAEPKAVPFWSAEEVEASIAATIAHLQVGGVLAYPTETVYGFGGAVDYESVERLVRLKRRPSAKPFLLLISASEMLTRLGLHLTSSAARIAARHWPGPVTLVLPGGLAACRTVFADRKAASPFAGHRIPDSLVSFRRTATRLRRRARICQGYRRRCPRPKFCSSGAMR